jgi:tripartite-type tricarboxylate transporter receptor subunit TctC
MKCLRLPFVWRIVMVSAAASYAFAFPAQAQNYPNNPVKLVVPYPPGGMADTFARTLGDNLSSRLGQPVVVENKPGGSLVIGTNAVAKSLPDGYTIGLGSVSGLAINVSALKKLPYDPIKDFAPIAITFRTPLYLMIAPDLPVNSVKELIAYAKANPGALSFASLGYGSSLHIAGEQFKKLAHLDLLHIPYKGTTTALPDLMQGRVSMIFDGGAFLSLAREGKLRMLAVSTRSRLDTLPDVPTMAEAGVPGYEIDLWFGIIAPFGTPQPIVQRLAREITAIVQQPAFRERFAGFPGIQFETGTSQEMAATIKRDIELWRVMLGDAKIEPQ